MGYPFVIDSTKINSEKLLANALKKPIKSAHPKFEKPIDFSNNKAHQDQGLSKQWPDFSNNKAHQDQGLSKQWPDLPRYEAPENTGSYEVKPHQDQGLSDKQFNALKKHIINEA